MTTPAARDTLSTDFALMAQAAAATDARSTEVRGLLHTFIARMTAVPPTVWSGASAVVFRDVVDRWNSESMRLCAALDGIEQKLKQLKLSIRNAPQGQSGASLGKCIFTGEPATQEVLIARAY